MNFLCITVLHTFKTFNNKKWRKGIMTGYGPVNICLTCCRNAGFMALYTY